MPPAAHEFIKDNYLPIAFRTRALGKMLKNENDSSMATYDFEIAVPADYVLVTETPHVGTILDGKIASQPQYLKPGHHQAVVPPGSGRVAVVWSRVIEKRFSPFAAIPDDQIRPED
jgi:hypothetical protein